MRTLTVSVLLAVASFSIIRCGGDDATTSIADASMDDRASSDSAALVVDSSAGDVPADNRPDDVAVDVASDGSANEGTVNDAQGEGVDADTDAATPGDAALAIDVDAKTPSVADNPPIPAGYKVILQSEVTPEMTTWAVMILNDPTDYAMFDTVTKAFEELTVLLRVEWHPPDFQNSTVHRGVTLYVPI